MPHISKHILTKQTKDNLNKTLLSLILHTNSKQRLTLLQELLTKTELLMLAKRLGIILLLEQGFSSYKISRVLGVSDSTVNRFSRNREYGLYRKSAQWIHGKTPAGKLEKAIENLVKLAFTGKIRSIKDFLDEK
jgi:uncharacterized protein YerC